MAEGANRSPDEREPGDDDEPGWISALVSAAGAVGMNKVRVRWKLRAWLRRRRDDRHRVVNKATAVAYQHKVCGHCTAVNDRGETTCTRCGRPLSARPVELARRVGIGVPERSMTAVLGVAIVAVYAACLLAHPTANAFAVPWDTLAEHGANLPGTDEPARALTSLLVHDGLFQVLLTVFTVAVVGGMVERELGPALLAPVFLIAGGCGATASDWLGRDHLGMGAAAGVVGLIGAGAVIGHRAGHARGRTYRNELLSLCILVVGFGLFFSTDYRALAPALVVGAVLGWALPRAVISARPWLTWLLALTGAVAVGALAVVAAAPMI